MALRSIPTAGQEEDLVNLSAIGRLGRTLVTVAFPTLAAAPALAQECPPCPPPPPAPPAWIVSIGGGLSLTGGNTESNSYNLSFSVTHDPKKKNLFKAEGLYLRSDADGEAIADRLNTSLRDEYTLWPHSYAFAQIGYQKDRFKDVDYLVAPGVGFGYRFVETEWMSLAADASLGGAFERLTDLEATSDLALQAGQRFEWKISGSSTLAQKAAALWKTQDFGDAYYRLEISLATAVARKLELKLTFADDYKTRPPRPELKKNDTAFLAALVYKH